MADRRILFLTHTLPWPLDAGAKVRAYYMLRHLVQRHRVTLASFVRPTDGPKAIEHLADLCETVHTIPMWRSVARDAVAGVVSFATSRPALIVRERSGAFRGLLRRLLAETRFDVVHVDQLKMEPHVEGLVDLPPRVIDKHNVYYEMIGAMARLTTAAVRRRLLAREARLMERYEGRACLAFDEILAVTDRDARRLSEMVAGQRPVTALPICVDPRETPVLVPNADSRVMLCIGAMFYPPNVDGVLWFLREILPRIAREVPEARLRIVGPRFDRAIARLAAGNKRVEICGYVQDLSVQFAASALVVVPLRAGSGMRVKILDAMARGIPVISTRLGAEGIEATDGDNILLADTSDAFARAVGHLFSTPETRRRIAGKARRLVEERYDWRRRYGEVDAVYERLFDRGETPQ